MATVFWGSNVVLLVLFMESGPTIIAASYSVTLERLLKAIKNKQTGTLSSGIVLLHDNVRLCSAAASKKLLQHFRWEVFDHPWYSPDLAPSDYHLFAHMKRWLGGQEFDSDELQTSIQNSPKAQQAAFNDEGIGYLLPCYNKRLNWSGDYAEE